MKKTDQKILIVDDNTKNLQFLAKLLSDKGYTVETAMSGTEALVWVEKNEFDLILLDIMMPGMDGFEVSERINTDEKNSDLPIIFLTAKTDLKSLTRGFSKGGVDYLTKPFNSEELLARVKTHIELKKAKQQLKQLNRSLEEKVAKRTKELKVSNDELARANADLEELDTVKTEFLRMISHEVRTPLNGIIGSLELLKLEELPQETHWLIHVLDESIKRLENFSIAALDISQIRAKGKELLKPEKILALPMITKCIQNLSALQNEKKITIDTVGLTDNMYFHGDKYFISKCINNILTNAMNYSPGNGKITIEGFEDKYTFNYIIKDNGPGFPELRKNKLFKPFSHGEGHMEKQLGLGLYLAKLIMDIHSGDIKISNTENNGACVQLSFKKNLN